MILRLPEIVVVAVSFGTTHAWIRVDPAAVRMQPHHHPSPRTTTTSSVVDAPSRCRRQQSTTSRNPGLLRRNAGAGTPSLPPNRNQEDDDSDSDNEEQDEDCAQEDECEIDWDTMMPPTDSNNNDVDDMAVAVATMKEQLERQFAATASTKSSSTTSSMDDNTNIPAIERHGDSRQTVTSHTLRQRLEMQWQVTDQALQNDECDVYEPASCGGQACTACQGRGHAVCRFCQGTCSLRLRTVHDDGTVETANVACQICNASGRESCRACQGTGWVADWTSIGGGVHVGGNSNNNNRPPARSGGLLP